jgi:hypothetical protein
MAHSNSIHSIQNSSKKCNHLKKFAPMTMIITVRHDRLQVKKRNTFHTIPLTAPYTFGLQCLSASLFNPSPLKDIIAIHAKL